MSTPNRAYFGSPNRGYHASANRAFGYSANEVPPNVNDSIKAVLSTWVLYMHLWFNNPPAGFPSTYNAQTSPSFCSDGLTRLLKYWINGYSLTNKIRFQSIGNRSGSFSRSGNDTFDSRGWDMTPDESGSWGPLYTATPDSHTVTTTPLGGSSSRVRVNSSMIFTGSPLIASGAYIPLGMVTYLADPQEGDSDWVPLVTTGFGASAGAGPLADIYKVEYQLVQEIGHS